jgi:hypothetical protein
MFRKHLAAALAALLAVAACAPRARAQSGRHFPPAAVEREFIALTDEKSDVAKEVRPRRVKDKSFDLRSLNAGRSAPVVFAEDGGGCKSTKCRVAVGAFFVYLVVAIAAGAASDNP